MQSSQVDLADGLPTIDLVSDVVVRAGQRLSVSGNGGTLRLGKRQVQVHLGGALELTRLGIAESAMSSAIVIEGVAAFANSTFIDCSARLNAVSEHGLESRGGAIAVIGGGTLKMLDCSMRRNAVRDGIECSGGALFIHESSSAELVGTELSNNMAIGGRTGAYGGAVRVRGSSSLRSVRSTLSRNVADGGSTTSFYVAAGAVYIDGDSVGEFSESEIVENIARAGLCCPNGGAFYMFNGSRLVLATSKINRNVAEGGVYSPSGGAISISGNSSNRPSEIAGCELLENTVRGGRYPGAGARVPREREGEGKG